MAKKIVFKNQIKSATDLVTSREETRAGFIAMAIEKNNIAIPYIEEAKALKVLANQLTKPKDLLEIKDLRLALLTASGLSDKSLKYLNEDDKTIAIEALIEKFLEPAGDDFVDELVYRYLLTKGDALGGKARNLAGILGERKFLRTMISVFNVAGIPYKWKDCKTNIWIDSAFDDSQVEKNIKALYWKAKEDRLLILNVNVPLVKKNVDIVVMHGSYADLSNGDNLILSKNESYITLGELKGGIDPAGADEHWKTANSALERIRKSFGAQDLNPTTFFIGAAIENSMAEEIFKQIKNKTLTHAVNLTKESQLTNICYWLISV